MGEPLNMDKTSNRQVRRELRKRLTINPAGNSRRASLEAKRKRRHDRRP